MSFGLALYAALGWAVSDYLTAIYGRRHGSSRLTFFVQSWPLVTVPIAAWVLGGTPNVRDMSLGAIAGAALASMSNETDSQSSGTSAHRSLFDLLTLICGIGSGLGFGAVYAILGSTHSSSGLWPILTMRVWLPFLYGFMRVRGASVTPNTSVLRDSFLISTSAVTAMAAFVVGARMGSLAIVTAISATSPAGSVLMAHWLGHERTGRVQIFGAFLAVLGVIFLGIR